MVYSSSKLREKVSLASNPDNSNKTSYSVMMQNYIQDENAKHEKANSNAIFEEETEEKEDDNRSEKHTPFDNDNDDDDDDDQESEVSITELKNAIVSMRSPPLSSIKTNVSVIHKKQPYYFLLDEELEQNIELEQDKHYEVRLCIYSIRTNILKGDPYLVYLMEKLETEMYSFSHFALEPTIIGKDRENNENDDDELSDTDNINDEDTKLLFMNKCKEHFYSIFKFFPDSSLNEEKLKSLSECFKGFVNPKDGDNTIYVVLNVDPIYKLREESQLPDNYLWATLHEILYENTIYNIPVNPSIIKWFSQNDYLLHLRNDDNVKIDNPFMLYSYSPKTRENNEDNKIPKEDETKSGMMSYFSTNTEEENKEEEKKEEEKEKTIKEKEEKKSSPKNTISLLPEINDDEKYGSCYYFSSKMDSQTRFVVYPKKTKYTLPDKYMYSKPRESESETEDEGVFDDNNSEEENVSDDDFLSIYNQDEGIPVWCIKTIDHFVIL